MGLLSFLKRNKTEAASPRGGSRATESVADSVQQVKVRARRRLIGAAVLVIVAVIGFPLIFETQPRSLPNDVPIEIAGKNAPAASPSSTRPAPAIKPVTVPPGVVVEPPPDAEKEAPTQVAAAPLVVPAPAPTPAPAAKPVEPEAKKVEVKKVEIKKPEEKKPEEKKPAPKPAEVAKVVSTVPAPAAPKSASAPAKAASAANRYVVQVGAFTDAAAVKEARAKVEKLGLSTYTQPVDSATGKRIRVRIGPFTSREEAEKAAAKIKPTGLQTAVFTL
jgi:DedD protein